MLEEIRIFLAVAAAGNFSAVAKSLDIAVSSVTRKVNALEAELDVRLFGRSSRRVTLTDAGEQFLTTAQSIVAEMDHAKELLLNAQTEPRGLLTVAAPSAFGRRHIAPAVASFLNRHPLIELDLYLSDGFIDLSVQRVDVAVRIGSLPDSELVAVRLAPVIRLACAAPSYIQRYGAPATPEDLLGHNCLTVTSKPAPTGWWCFPGVNGGVALSVQGTFRADDTETLLQAAVQGLGVVHLASWLVADMIAAGKLITLFPQKTATVHTAQTAIHAVRLPGRSHVAKARLFIEHLKNEFGSPAYWDVS